MTEPSKPQPMAYSYLRMSSDIQLKGDSRRRQLNASAEYADQHELVLAGDAQLEDIGISAFKGRNISEGALGKFLAAAESGRVPRGSYLLVESLDRISRQKPEIAQALFLRILAAGINLVTLADKHVYRSGNTDIGELIVSLIKLNVANEESENKSFRVGAAWKNKRVDAKALKPMTALCPGWLKLSDSRKTYELRADRAELVRRIFHEAANGIGASAIASRLNSESISPFGKSNGWRKSYVVKILNSRAVLGEFQPHTLRSNKRVEDGEPILNYFPRVVDDATFFKAQTGRAQRRTGGGGRKGKYVSNLFSGMTKCGHCGGTVVFENKGSSPKGGQYLVCDNAKRKLGCSAKRWRYADFELSFLTFVQEIDLAKILQPSSDSDARTATEAEIAVLKGNIALIKERRERTFELFEKGMATEYIADKLREQEELLASLTAELTVKTNELTELAHEINAFGTGKDDIIELLERLPSQGGGDLYKIRSTIAARLKALIRFLEISTLGVQQEARNEAAAYKQAGLHDHDYVRLLEREAADVASSYPSFYVIFKNGVLREVCPDPVQPSNILRQYDFTEGRLYRQIAKQPRVELFRPDIQPDQFKSWNG